MRERKTRRERARESERERENLKVNSTESGSIGVG